MTESVDRRYEALLAAVPGVVCRYLLDGTLTESSALDRDLELVDELSKRWSHFRPDAFGERHTVELTWQHGRRDNDRWLVSRAALERDENGDVLAVVVVTSDVTSLHVAEERVVATSRHDGLTGLPNAAQLAELLETDVDELAATGPTIRMAVLDIDGFAQVNATDGYRRGDEVLKATAQAIAACLREADVAFRLVDDEFAVLFAAGLDAEHAVAVASRMRAAIGDASEAVLGRRLTMSVGLARSEPGLSPAALSERAGLAADSASDLGGDAAVIFDDAARQVSADEQDRAEQLRRAIDEDQLVVAFQPLVDLQSHEVVGAEALVRWQHPTDGLLLPDEFVPLAERMGLVVDLTRAVLDRSLRALAEFHHAHPGVRFSLSVNMSAADLAQPLFIEVVHDALESHDIEPASLCLELTETAVIEDLDLAISTLRQLRDLGVTIAIDDFGTGYASLSVLRELPVDRLKIDQTFVRGLPRPADLAVVRLVVGLARELDLVVTAEGIGTTAQAEQLQQLGCATGQGSLFSAPVFVGDLSELGDVVARRATNVRAE